MHAALNLSRFALALVLAVSGAGKMADVSETVSFLRQLHLARGEEMNARGPVPR
jgi:hypothetical protein